MKVPIPLTVLTGFLGSGKTTLLKALLSKPEMAGTAVIVNEFGDVGLDDALIESSSDETVLLPSGCVCCAVRGDLVEALNRLYEQMRDDKIPEITRVILETSGLADPAPIAHTLMTDDALFRLYRLDGIVSTVDSELVESQLDTYFETAKQIAIADRVVLTKIDRVGAPALTRSKALVATLNPAAKCFEAAHGDCDVGLLTELAAFEPAVAKTHAATWLAADQYEPAHACSGDDCDHPQHHHDHSTHEHSHGISSFALTFEKPLDGHKLSFAMELLRMTHGGNLLRVKGILNVAGEDLPFVVHGVQHIFYPPTTLDAWPSDDRRSKLVFIVKDLTAPAVQAVLQPLLAPSATVQDEAFYTP